MDVLPWWQTGAIYQIYPRSFADSNDDGVGDLAGVTGHLEYLAGLGVAAIWLSPFYPSPMDDFGYDVTDHTGVDPVFGTVADAEELIEAAHRHGLRVIVDFIPNHTSYQHPWFVASRTRDDQYADWYYWRDPAPGGGPPNNWLSVFGGPAWTFDDRRGQYYYHAYLPEQPDLNWRNPAVRTAQYDVLRTWLARGVDGFRIDAFRQLLKDPQWRDNPPNPEWQTGDDPYLSLRPVHSTDQADIVDVIAELRSVLPDQAALMAELYLPLDKLMRYYGTDGSGIHLPTNMHLVSSPWTPTDIAHLAEEYEALLPSGAWPNWVTGNHDRSRIASRIGPAQARVAAVLLLTLRGTPTLYYGEELGMLDIPVSGSQLRDPLTRRLPDQAMGRDPERTPMRWTSAYHAGFCPDSVTPWLPTEPHPAGVDVKSQDGSPTSMLTLYRALLEVRQTSNALRTGAYRTVLVTDDVLVYERRSADAAQLIALNFTDRPQPITLPPGAHAVLSTHELPAQPTTLRPNEGLVLQQSLDPAASVSM
ncbi:alpha-glucosidase [Kribbella steppae]|uniref:Alpha-glucosidase n=1 Tax=Kribbella steppae TaxID=2512223 RepID=A0A4R2HQU5_9ACTN|nr:alpha-amylase family glycosyl hydrolase [Kribbella steppae]TCO33349.1 alpha-glucosidase [Kribbella steppae]